MTKLLGVLKNLAKLLILLYLYFKKNQMTRIEAINTIIKIKKVNSYLEIGVNKGKCLFNIKGAKNRFAVDPFFNFNAWKKFKGIVKNFDNLRNRYFELTSDDFFSSNANMLSKNVIDLAFIDGLHTYKQSLMDTINTLKYLDEKGVIILHDCNPLDELAAIPAVSIDEVRKNYESDPNWKNIWNGDVWKTVVHIRKNYPDLTAFVLDTDHGLGFVYKKNREELPKIFESISNIDSLDYSFFEKNRKDLIDLKPISYFNIFIKQL